MRAMVVEVGPEIEQLIFQICGPSRTTCDLNTRVEWLCSAKTSAGHNLHDSWCRFQPLPALATELCSAFLLCAKLIPMLPLRCVWQRYFRPSLTVLWELLRDGLQFLNVVARSRTAVAAEVLFLRKQLAYYRDHQIRPRRLSDAARLSLVLWSRLFDWKEALMVVTPGTLVGWHRKGFKRYWRWKSRGGRPALPKDIRQLIARLVRENITWGEERVADELSLKLGILVSPRTVRKYWPCNRMGSGRDGRPRSTGERSSRIMPKGSSPATFWLP
jgi:hypothetical protein